MDISPKAEPVAWSVIVGSLIAALTSYGLNITNELRDFLILVVPFLIGGAVARWYVTPVGKKQSPEASDG